MHAPLRIFSIAAAAAALAAGAPRPAPRPPVVPVDRPALHGTIISAVDCGRDFLDILLALTVPDRRLGSAARVWVSVGPRTPVRDAGRGAGRRAGGRELLRPGAVVRVFWHGVVMESDPGQIGSDSVVVERPAP